ncbi:RHS repeat-associated core domain-containing protein, partial [Joostella sp. CR20]
GKEELIAHNEYDALGQLIQKKVGNTQSKPLQTIDYSYNVRGWLTAINDADNLGSDLFGFELGYNTSRSGAEKLYNGNISETYWKTKSDNVLRRYAYSYDALNRITKGAFNG